MSFMFQNLLVYQRALRFAEEISAMTEKFPKGNFHIIDQLNRASLSISLNIAEGNGRWHKADRKQFFYIARGSTHECVPLLELCLRKGLIAHEAQKQFLADLIEIAKMLSGLIQGIENRQS